jgi:Domain of unknown function (DUF6457)
VNPWLAAARDGLAQESGVELELQEGEAATLLELARIAAHESGDRRNAPLLCYLLGLARGGGSDLERLAAAVPRSSS